MSIDREISKNEIQAALKFIAGLRRDMENDPRLGTELSAGGLDALLNRSLAQGYKFSREALLAAHNEDWGMRLFVNQYPTDPSSSDE